MANDQIIRDLEDMHVLASAHARVSEAAVRGVWAAVDRLRAENERLSAIVDRLRNAELSQCGWEADEDIVLLNRKPVGCTIRKDHKEFERWWPAVKRELLAEAIQEQSDE